MGGDTAPTLLRSADDCPVGSVQVVGGEEEDVPPLFLLASGQPLIDLGVGDECVDMTSSSGIVCAITTGDRQTEPRARSRSAVPNRRTAAIQTRDWSHFSSARG